MAFAEDDEVVEDPSPPLCARNTTLHIEVGLCSTHFAPTLLAAPFRPRQRTVTHPRCISNLKILGAEHPIRCQPLSEITGATQKLGGYANRSRLLAPPA